MSEPILKWAGGKRQLLSEILPLIPNNINRYYEPFLGAGAVLLELEPSRAIVNDINSELINVYYVIRDNPEALIELLFHYNSNHSRELYYETRNLDRDVNAFNQLSNIEKAARTVYLNRTCFNGLYRVNRHGQFNTPMGHNSSIQIVNPEGIRSISTYLNNNDIQILNTDYRSASRWMRRNDFIFLDPPYYPIRPDSFVRYDASVFNINEQVELKLFCDSLNGRGIRFLQTNSDCIEVRELYNNYNLLTVNVQRSINANADDRHATELIITNY